jgi:hypothetical protein
LAGILNRFVGEGIQIYGRGADFELAIPRGAVLLGNARPEHAQF